MIRTVGETGSTNADMLELARSGASEGLWLRAERQTAGRGRQGRGWTSPAGNLHASTLIRLHDGEPPAATLALVAAVALEEVVAAYAPEAALSIKWPNDLLAGGAKLAGILLERADHAVVLGIGVNLAHHPDSLDRPVISIAALAGAAPGPADFLAELAEGFARWLARWRCEGLGPVRARWLDRAHPPGTALVVALPDGSRLEGLFDGLEADCALRLRLADGGSRVIHAGDVFLI